MMKKNKGKKTLTAMSAVVAVGLTPGAISSAPAIQPQPNAGITAADVVTIGGRTYGFDELIAMQQLGNTLRSNLATPDQPQVTTKYGVQRPPQNATHYGVPHPQGQVVVPQRPLSELEVIQGNLMEYCARIIDADTYGIMITLDSDLTCELEMNEDELKELVAKIEKNYGVKVPNYRLLQYGPLNTLRHISDYIYDVKKPSARTIQWNLIEYCAQLIDAYNRGIFISLDSDLTSDLGMTDNELKELAAEIKNRYGVEVSYHRFRLIGQLNTLRLVTEYIYKIKHLWD